MHGREREEVRLSPSHGHCLGRICTANTRPRRVANSIDSYGRGRDFVTTLMHQTCNPNSEVRYCSKTL